MTFALEEEKLAFAMKLKFLCCATFVKFSVPKYVCISAVVDPIEVLDS